MCTAPPANSVSFSGRYGAAAMTAHTGGSAEGGMPSSAAASPHHASVCAPAALVYAESLMMPLDSSGEMTPRTVQLPAPSCAEQLVPGGDGGPVESVRVKRHAQKAHVAFSAGHVPASHALSPDA